MKSLLVALALFLGFGSASTAHAAATIYDGLLSRNRQENLSTFVDLMNQAFGDDALKRMFDGKEKFTLFAPTNEAFEAYFSELSAEALAELRDVDNGVLQELLRFHITRGEWSQPTGALRMLDDEIAQTYSEGITFKIDQATILKRSRFRNGTVAVIDLVMSNQAKGATVHFLNCDTKKISFWVFNGGDPLCIVPRHIVTLAANGGAKSRMCNDKKNGCKIVEGSDAGPGNCFPVIYAKNGQTVIKEEYTAPYAANGVFNKCN